MFDDILSMTAEEKRTIAKDIGPIRSMTGFASEFVEATKEIPLKDHLVKLLPWAAKGGEIAGEAVPLAKVLIKLVDEIVKEKDPETLGLLACSLAYQRSAALAIAQTGEPKNRVPFEQSLQSARESLKNLQFRKSLDGFSLDAPLAHPFVWQADEVLSLAIRGAGYSDSEWRKIQLRTHDQFRTDLVEVLAHGEAAARFEPFTRRMSLGDHAAAFAALNAHIERQRWLFEDRPVLNVEPFALADVYIDADCGKLLWKDFPSAGRTIREDPSRKFDPFSEDCGGRQPLLDTVLSYLQDPKFNDAIVIQGAPGCGKSSFTLRLSNELRRQGLRPLRVRLKFLDLKKNLSSAIAEVVLQPEEGEDPALSLLPRCSDPFLNDSIFHEKTTFGKAEICPYVIILDGWDEISVAVNEGFEIEARRMLDSVRRQFLHPRPVKVRVLLTGRPSHAVERSQFLLDDTPVLTVRENTPDQLASYVANVKRALEHPSLALSSENIEKWTFVKWDNVDSAVNAYRDDKSKLEILGSPLLAHLSVKLLGQWVGDPSQLLSDRTALYRYLLDVTCQKAGKSLYDSDDLLGQERIKGLTLRKMLHQTAVAITAFGRESIPFVELQLRLNLSTADTMDLAEAAGRQHPLTALMMSFYFKGGREHLGCEFLHKSFREYLYAEAVVEALKDYGRNHSEPTAPRRSYWRDFEESDPRRQFSRELSQMLCPYPLTAEIRANIANLLMWEIGRSSGTQPEAQIGQSLTAATLSQWELVRDTLADLWDWWGEGVHLRPQPYRDKSKNLLYQPAFVNELLDYSLPLDRGRDTRDWWPGRLVNADANIGDALCRLNALVHALILLQCGWEFLATQKTLESLPPDAQPHPYQTRSRNNQGLFVQFKPSGADPAYLRNYCSRINAAGNRPGGPFPGAIDLIAADLKGVNLRRIDFCGADLIEVNLAGAELNGVDLSFASLTGANLYGARLAGADLGLADLQQANLSHADLRGADLTASLVGANLSAADLRLANLEGADLGGSDCSRANFAGAILASANIAGASFDEAISLSQEQLDSVRTENAEDVHLNGNPEGATGSSAVRDQTRS